MERVMKVWAMITIIALAAIVTDMISKNKKIELKRIEKEIELETIKLKAFEIETEKMRLELDYSKQQLLELKSEVK